MPTEDILDLGVDGQHMTDRLVRAAHGHMSAGWKRNW
jgi:hypothetical protein